MVERSKARKPRAHADVSISRSRIVDALTSRAFIVGVIVFVLNAPLPAALGFDLDNYGLGGATARGDCLGHRQGPPSSDRVLLLLVAGGRLARDGGPALRDHRLNALNTTSL